MTRWVLFDDPRSEGLFPLTRLRPASALLLGAETGEERWRRCVGDDPVQVICRERLARLEPDRIPFGPDAGRAGDAARETGDLWVSDRILPDESVVAELRRLEPGDGAYAGEELMAYRPAEQGDAGATTSAISAPDPAARETLASLAGAFHRRVELDPEGVLSGLPHLITRQARLIEEDLDRIVNTTTASSDLADGVGYRPERIVVEPGCRLDHGAVLDAREGPIFLGAGTEVAPHTWIQGPFYARGQTQLLGGRIGGGASFGPHCRVRGEVDSSVFLGYVNKAHDGFVGHSYLGQWVNLGAFTTTSDLKNNYSEIKLEIDGRSVPGGTNKVGAFLGDHVKTRIGCLLNTGSVVGVGANLIGEPAVPTTWVPDFLWGAGEDAVDYDLSKFLRTAEIVMKRRGVELTVEMKRTLQAAHEETTSLRVRYRKR